jgi:excisionase family DNA binding protein
VKENAMRATIEHERQITDEPPAGAGGFERRVSADPTASRTSRLRIPGARVEQLLTVAEAAQCVGCCEETIRRAYLARQLDVLRFGARRVRIRPAALTAWLERGGKTTAV